MLKYAFSVIDNDGNPTILNMNTGNIFPAIRFVPEGQTETFMTQGDTLIVTNVSPEPVSSGLVTAGLGLVAFGFVVFGGYCFFQSRYRKV